MNGAFDAVQEILDAVPSTKLACALFMIISNWAILAIFTAVVSENMITTVEDRRRENEDEENVDKTERSIVKLPLVATGVSLSNLHNNSCQLAASPWCTSWPQFCSFM